MRGQQASQNRITKNSLQYVVSSSGCRPLSLGQQLGVLNIDILLMIEILHYLQDPKLWESWYIPYYG